MTVEVDLERRRGDTFADRFTLKQDGVALDVTGASFLMSVNTEKAPADNANQLYQLTGTIVDAAGGVVEFAPSAVQADQTPAGYFYDVQMTDSGGAKRTLVAGKLKVVQDITKD